MYFFYICISKWMGFKSRIKWAISIKANRFYWWKFIKFINSFAKFLWYNLFTLRWALAINYTVCLFVICALLFWMCVMANALHFSSLKLFCLNFYFIHGAWVERLISDGDKNGKLFLKKKTNQNKTFGSIHIYSQSRFQKYSHGVKTWKWTSFFIWKRTSFFYLKVNEF